MNPRILCALSLLSALIAVPVFGSGPSDVASSEVPPRIGHSATPMPEDTPSEPDGDGESPRGAVAGSGGADVQLGGSNESTIAVNPTNPWNIAYAALWEMRVSNDGGLTFQPRVPAVVDAGSGTCGDPSVAFDSQGRLFWTYLGCVSGGLDLYIAQCDPTTGAILSGYPINVTNSPGVNMPGSAGSEHDKEWLAVDTSSTSPFTDRLYIVWTEFPQSAPVRVLATSSADQGVTWTPAIELSTPSEGFMWPTHNTVAPNGDVYAAYHSQPGWLNGAPNGVSGQIIILRSTDGGATYPQKTLAYLPGQADFTFNVQDAGATIPQTQFWLQGSAQPWVLADPNVPGRIYVVASDDPDNDNTSADFADVFINISTDNGLTWGTPSRIDSGPGTTFQVMPTAGIDRDTGCIFVHYYDNRAGAVNGSNRFLLDVFMTSSSDGGLSFVSDFQINDVAFDPDIGAPVRFTGPPPTTRIGEYNGVAVDGCTGYAVWTGNRPGGQQAIFDSAAGALPAQPCELDKITAADAAVDDRFGASVSISGDRAVVGAYYDDDAGDRTGSAYVFRRSDNGTPSNPTDDTWVEEDKLTASDGAVGDVFGYSVSISGDRIVVGAYGNDDAGIESGSAYVFRRDDNGTPSDPTDDFWVEEDKLTASDAAGGDWFGMSVSNSGDRVVVGAYGDDDAGSSSGSAYVFRRDNNGTPLNPSDDVWVEEDKLNASDAAASDFFGHSVSISGDRAVVGAFRDDDAGADSGSAYVFRRVDNGTPADPSDDSWVQEDKLTASDAAEFDRFGYSVSIGDDRAVVGAYHDDDACTGDPDCDSGSAYVFRYDPSQTICGEWWCEEQKLTASDAAAGDEFGQAVALNGDTAVTGAVSDDDAGSGSGSAYVFRRSGNSWSEVSKLTASDAAAGDRFGISVALDGNRAIVGAHKDDTNPVDAGSAYVFAVGGDCNHNAVADECDLLFGPSIDSNTDGQPDECSCVVPSVITLDALGPKNRYLSINVTDVGASQAIRVTFNTLPSEFAYAEQRTAWVGQPVEVSENAGKTNPADAPGSATFLAAELQCNPYETDWNALGTVHVYDMGFVPGGVYQVQAIANPDVSYHEGCYSGPLLVRTSKWGDVISDCGTTPCGPPDGSVDVTTDVTSVLNKFKNLPDAPIKARSDLDFNLPDQMVNISDVTAALNAFGGFPYPFVGPPLVDPCP